MTTTHGSTALKEKHVVTRNFVRECLVAGCVLLLTLGALEVAVRIWGYSERAAINTDSLGLRAKIAGASYGAKQPNEYRIAVVGDSVTFGEGVTRTEDTFAQVLEDMLNQRQQALTVKVFNYGVSAYSVKEMAGALQYRVMDIQPDLVVMAIIPSDFNLARTPGIDSEGYFVDKRISFLHDSQWARSFGEYI